MRFWSPKWPTTQAVPGATLPLLSNHLLLHAGSCSAVSSILFPSHPPSFLSRDSLAAPGPAYALFIRFRPYPSLPFVSHKERPPRPSRYRSFSRQSFRHQHRRPPTRAVSYTPLTASPSLLFSSELNSSCLVQYPPSQSSQDNEPARLTTRTLLLRAFGKRHTCPRSINISHVPDVRTI